MAKELRIEGVIGDVFNTAEDIRNRVDSLGLEPNEQLDVVINSAGGSVFEGFGIYNYFRSLDRPLTMTGDGLVGSIATLILSSAPKENTSLSEVSMFMIHRAVAPAIGNTEDLEKQAEILKTIDNTLIDVYSSRTGMDPKTIEQMMSEETWLSGREAFDQGFVGVLTNPIPAEAVAKAFVQLNNEKEMSLKTFFEKFRAEGEAPTEETTVATDQVIEEPQNKTSNEDEEEKEKEMKKNEGDHDKDKKNFVTREEFDALSNSIDKFAEMMSQFLETAENSAKSQEAKMEEIQEGITNKVESKFKAMVNSLPSSSNAPIVEETMSDEVNHDPWAKHREHMAEINAKAQAKLRDIV